MLLALIAQAYAKEPTSSFAHDKIFDRAIGALLLRHVELDNTTLEKSRHLVSPGSRLSQLSSSPHSLLTPSPSSHLVPTLKHFSAHGSSASRLSRTFALKLPFGGMAKKVKDRIGDSNPAAEQRLAKQLEYDISKASIKNPFEPTAVGSYSYAGVDPLADPGRPKVNQDTGYIVRDFGGNPEQALFAVYDGHGLRGDKVAQFISQMISNKLEEHPGLVGDETAAFEHAFTAADKALAPQKKMDAEWSGSTAVAALLRGDKVWVANVGDTRCILASNSKAAQRKGGVMSREIKSKELSKTHSPDLPSEKKRIEQSGGFVSPPPGPGLSARVWSDAAMTQVGIAMARSIGDHAVTKLGVIATPDVQAYDLTSDDQFMILATDGIWEFVSSQEAVEIVWEVLRNGGSASDASRLLIEKAALLWNKFEDGYRDDITAIVVSLASIQSPSAV